MATVILDAGHGGNDLGVVYERRFEKNDNLKLTDAIGSLLMNNGINVKYIRDTDTYMSPIDRVNKANKEGGDLYVALHRAISPIADTLYGVRASVYQEEGLAQTAAENILSNLEKLGFHNIGVQTRQDLVILRQTDMPSFMLEVGYINSKQDNEIYDTHFNEVAQAIASGIIETLGGQTGVTASQVNTNQCQREERNMEGYRYCVQLGLFRDYNRAMDFQKLLFAQGCPADIEKQGDTFAVRVGDYSSLDDAVHLERLFRRMGHKTLVVAVYQK